MTPRKNVSFNQIEIIELPYTVGDGPACGVPVSIGWEPIDRSVFAVNFFESFRPARRTKPALRLTSDQRKQLLLKNGHSLKEIADGEEQSLLLRKERIRAIRMLRKLQTTQQMRALEKPPIRPTVTVYSAC